MKSLESTRRSQLFRHLGSFWYSIFSQPSKVRILLALGRQTSVIQAFESVTNNLAGYYDQAKYKSQQLVVFGKNDIIETGDQYFDDTEIAATQDAENSKAFSRNNLKYYALRLKDILPLIIQAPSRRLVLGIDFFIQRNEYIFFRQDPKELFPRGSYLVTLGKVRDLKPVMSPLLRSEALDNTYLIAYARNYQTPEYFKLAMAAEAGLGILTSAQRLIDVRSTILERIYEFEHETHRVSYFHTPLVVGELYPKHYIIGDGIRVFYGDATKNRWWRKIDWRGGMSLAPFSAFKHLNLLDKETEAYSAGSDAGSVEGSKQHVRIKLSDDFWAEKPFWEEVARKETKTGYYLNHMLGLPEAVDSGNATIPDTFEKLLALNKEANDLNLTLGRDTEQPEVTALPNQLVNALDVFFEGVFAKRGFVVLVDQNRVKNAAAAFKFASREMLAGCTPIVFSYAPDLPIESVRLNGNIRLVESVNVENAFPKSATETVALTAVLTDYVLLRHEAPEV